MRSVMPGKGAPENRFRVMAWVALIAAHVLLGSWFLAATDGGPDDARTGFPLDDAWIHLVYGSSVASDFAPKYNDAWETGFTSPAWMLFLALAHWIASALSLSVVLVVKWMGVGLGALASILLFETLLRMGIRHAVALFAAGLHALSPWMTFAEISGMEIALTVGCGLATALLLLYQRPFSAGLAGAISVLARPEMLLVVAVLTLAIALPRSSKNARKLRTTAAFALPSAAALFLWSATCYLVSGHLLPNTFYAKFTPRDLESFPRIAGEFLFSLPLSLWFVGLPFLLLGTVYCMNLNRPLLRAYGAIPWILIAGTAASRHFPEGYTQFFYWQRYMLPALPFLLLLCALGIHQLALLLSKSDGTQSLGVRALLVFAMIFMTGMQIRELSDLRSIYSWNCRNINEVQVEFGHWVDQNVAANRAVAVNDAGAIRYFGRRFTFDLLGLNNHDLLFDRELAVGIRQDLLILHRFLLEKGVDYLIVFPSWFEHVVRDPRFSAYFAEDISFSSARYTISRGKQDTMVAYRVLVPPQPESRNAAGR